MVLDHPSSDTAAEDAAKKLNKSLCSSETSFEENSNSFTEDQVTLFQQRCDNGYDLAVP